MPLRRVPGPPDLSRVAAVLGGPPPARSAPGWVPEAPREASQIALLEEALATDEVEAALARHLVGAGSGAREPNAGTQALSAGAAPDPVERELDRLDADLRAARRPAVLTVPEPLRSGRLSVSGAAVVALLALVVAVACVFALRVLWAERSVDEVKAPVTAGRPAVSVRSGSTGAPLPSGTAGPSASGGQVVVHVVGQVKRPGLVRLGAGARVADAIERAGGATSAADLSSLNLARVLVDGEQVRVPRPGEVLPSVVAGGPPGPPGSADGGGAAGGSGALVNLNTADVATLDTLPGVGPVLAQRIIDWRTEHGRFTSVEELGEVSGIGEKIYAQIKPKVTV